MHFNRLKPYQTHHLPHEHQAQASVEHPRRAEEEDVLAEEEDEPTALMVWNSTPGEPVETPRDRSGAAWGRLRSETRSPDLYVANVRHEDVSLLKEVTV